jgi:hypothetical protein
MAVVVATGITAEGAREVLGVDVGDSEDDVVWRGFLRSLKTRGLGAVRLVISDQHAGLVAALRRTFQSNSSPETLPPVPTHRSKRSERSTAPRPGHRTSCASSSTPCGLTGSTPPSSSLPRPACGEVRSSASAGATSISNSGARRFARRSSQSPTRCSSVSPASHMGPPVQAERQQHGTTPAPVMGPPLRQ